MKSYAARAFSLMELLVSISIIAVLTSLAAAGVTSAREAARQLKCKTNIRNAGQTVMTYAAGYKDYLPFAGYQSRVWPDNLMPGAVKGIQIVMGGNRGLRHGYWSVMFPEQWSPTEFSPGLKCPGQPEFNRGVMTFLSDSPFPYYFLSSAMWLEEQAMTDSTSTLRAKPKPHHLGEITFPSGKSLFFEQASFCNRGMDLNEALNLGHTVDGRITVIFADLSVDRPKRMEGIFMPAASPGETFLPFDLTYQGIRGRDR